jgi:hypothetical protein
MRTTIRAAVLAATAFMTALPAAAQTSSTVSLVPDRWARWDVTAQVGRQGVNKSEFGSDWNGWYESGSFGAAAAFSWTPNLKLELDVMRAGQAHLYESEQVVIPGDPVQYFRSREHHFSTMTTAAGVVYQAFENRWFHPFAGGGVEIMREARRSDASQQSAFRNGVAILPPVGVAQPAETSVWTTARPFATTGFKVYVSPHAFLRSDLRVSLSRRGAESAVWRAGIGFDF